MRRCYQSLRGRHSSASRSSPPACARSTLPFRNTTPSSSSRRRCIRCAFEPAGRLMRPCAFSTRCHGQLQARRRDLERVADEPRAPRGSPRAARCRRSSRPGRGESRRPPSRCARAACGPSQSWAPILAAAKRVLSSRCRGRRGRPDPDRPEGQPLGDARGAAPCSPACRKASSTRPSPNSSGCRCPAADVLFEAGDPADAVYFVVSGCLGVYGPGGELIGRIVAGETVGEMGLIVSQTTHARPCARCATRSSRRFPPARSSACCSGTRKRSCASRA